MWRSSVVFFVLVMLASPVVEAADTWSTPHPGIRLLRRTTSAPIRAVAAEIDMCTPGVSFRVTKSGERQQRPSTFGAAVGAELVVNGDFFSFSNYSSSGLTIGDGEHWPGTADAGWQSALVFGNDRVELLPSSQIVTPAGWMNDAISGRPDVLRDGVVIGNGTDSLCTVRHPRTAVGLSRDGRKLYVAVIDGRSSSSRGMLCSEVGAFLKELGAYHGLNLDGGGSSSMWVRGQGTVNRPSDGTERVVANHLAVLAKGGTSLPESCNEGYHDAAELPQLWESLRSTTDVDGDGAAEVCARAAAGISCYSVREDGSGTRFDGPRLSNDNGWSDPSNYNTIRWGDVNGDGLADVCARSNTAALCWLSDGEGFPTRIEGPALADAQGWSAAQFYSTLRLGDFTGDGMDDLCVRTASELRCYPSTGDGFGPVISGPAMPSADGWNRPSRFGTIRMGDIDGDGALDFCARRASGMVCWLSERTGFGPEFAGPAWSDEAGFTAPGHWTTIRLVDVDGDGRADLCARTAEGVDCHLSTGSGFGPAIPGPRWSNASGWGNPAYFPTIQFADIDGDGDLDVCGRAAAGMRCVPWDGEGFGEQIIGPTLSNDSGWGVPQHLRTIRLGDFDGDGLADICARAGAGWRCWRSDGTGFGASIAGPNWTNASGWSGLQYWSTIAFAGPRCMPMPEVCNGVDDDCDGLIDEDDVCASEDDVGPGTGVDTGNNVAPDVGGDTTPTDPTAGSDVGIEPDPAQPGDITADGGCCSQTRAPASPWWLIVALLGLGRRRLLR